ncbi:MULTISPECIES: DUF1365 domain-containing protein [unclassified Ruegeria]|uniref:DUF1365 domain-containing protein n=1 Tax=unclassified Ruegeria TaxID=2625375 RepID=UPI001487D1BE|nr:MULTISPECIES: DUF1365 domain-containing protein [unclassified Ruegeria]NOD33093.1 DUF1365 family protein [Ruegeria sp. HKCCD7296]NOD48865.1 DUF1365 family protein [Ruegeria sp. HKCCD5849]NOD51832.1 DUF1365 family protein [Ruegeria sp. HKCCD5851]NOD66490.1 DUF1365 family protein [Ruegeria sp. HKCCD7303]NOE34023.1 DUF1365 family protein [Ruegeria sp. HKCCD7318]
MAKEIDHIAGHTYHGRKGGIENAFRYSVDYILFDPEAKLSTPLLFSRDRANLANWRTRDHGGAPGQGEGAAWVRTRFDEMAVPQPARIILLTQPRVLGHVFNPVSFWFCFDGNDQLYTVVAEVTNTFGTRHSYLCHKPDFASIEPSDRVVADKLMHVSPFQKIEGSYTFRFDFRPDRVGVWIDYTRPDGGLIATLTGPRQPLTNRVILWSLLRRPFGARRTFTLIVWQAFKLWLKKATFRPFRSQPVPDQPMSRVRD